MCVDIVLTFYRLGERLDIVQENPWPRAEGCPHKLSDPPSQWATTTGAQPRQHHPNVWPQGVSHSQHNVKLYFSLVIWSHVFFSKWGFEECIFYDSNRKLYTWIYLCTWIRVLVTVSSMLSCTIHLYILTLLAFPFFFIVLLSMIL